MKKQVDPKPIDPNKGRALLDAFLVDNPDFESLKAKLSTFNLFRVLRVERAEIRHSNVLGWLMNPDESHGLGTIFLRRFLSSLLLANETNEIELRPADVELYGLQNVEVRREWKNIDILAQFEVPKKGRWCLLIENKIRSKEARQQLARYRQIVKQEFAGDGIIPVYLTLDGEDPSEAGIDAGYIPWSHQEVLDLAEGIIEQNRGRVPEDAQIFLAHYLDTLRRLTMQDQELVDLCRKIYRTHREALDLIFELARSTEAITAFESFLGESVPCKFTLQRGNQVWFLPTSLAAQLPKSVELRSWRHLPESVPICCWFRLLKRRDRIESVLEVGPVADSATRIRFLKALKEEGFTFLEKSAFREDAKFTRILSKRAELPKDESGDPDTSEAAVYDTTKKLWGQIWKDGPKLEGVLKKFDWKTKS